MAIDTNSFEIENIETLKNECVSAKQYGFTAKAAIHPNQVDTINEVFSTLPHEIQKYQSLIEAYNSSDTGFIMVDGQVIAPPFIAKAKKMIAFFNKIRGNHD